MKDANLLLLLASTLETISQPLGPECVERLAEETFPELCRICRASLVAEASTVAQPEVSLQRMHLRSGRGMSV